MTIKIDTILFDMDGTIIQSLSIWDELIERFVGSENVMRFWDLRKTMPDKGSGMDYTCLILQNEFNIQKTREEILHDLKRTAQIIFEEQDIPFIEGFEDFHNNLIQNSIKTGLATNAPDYALNVVKRKLNLHKFFGQHIYNSCIVKKFKPDPAVFLHSLEKLNSKAENCVIFEDSSEGIEAARAAGILCVGIKNSTNEDELGDAHSIISDYKNLTLSSLITLL